MNLKQLFCKHIWKETEKRELLRETLDYNFVLGRVITIKHYAVWVTCVKCGKESIIEK